MSKRDRVAGFGRTFTATIVVLVAAVAMSAATPASAQQRQHQRSFLERLLGIHPPERRYPQQPRPPARHRTAPHRTRQPARHVAPKPAADTPAPVEKVDGARKILVLGDFIAGGLADGLTDAFATSPDVVVVDRTNGSSGLVREDYYDWPKEVGPILDEVKPAVAVVLLGSNDRQPITVDGESQPVLSDKWTAAYKARAKALADAIVGRHIPLLWAAVPAFRSPSMSADVLAFDGIFRSVVSAAGGEFVDTWDGFVDDQGNFVFTGSDVNGQPVRLRGSDGINLTEAGKRKLAFYVEKPARRILGEPGAGALNSPAGAAIGVTPDGGKADRTAPIGLDDPALDGDTALLGNAPLPAVPGTPLTLLVHDGRAETPPPGRADDFAWPPGTAAEKVADEKKKGATPPDAKRPETDAPADMRQKTDPADGDKASLR